MKYIILLLSLLVYGTSYAEPRVVDEVDPYLGKYAVTLQPGFKEGTPSCATVRRGQRIAFSISAKKNKNGDTVIKDSDARNTDSKIIDLYVDDGQMVIVYSDWSTIFRRDGRRTVILRNARDGYAEVAMVLDIIDEDGKYLCWTSFLGTGKFTPQRK